MTLQTNKKQTIQHTAPLKKMPKPSHPQNHFSFGIFFALGIQLLLSWVSSRLESVIFYVIIIYIASPLLPYIIAVSQFFFWFHGSPKKCREGTSINSPRNCSTASSAPANFSTKGQKSLLPNLLIFWLFHKLPNK